MKVLLADDDEDQLHLRAMVLAKSGFEIFQASDSVAALKAAREHKPNCAVVDLRFPTQAQGLALIRALRALNSAMCVIVLTGTDPANLDHLPEKSLIDEIIVKGSASARLVTALRRFAASITVEVKVIPRSSKSEVDEVMEDGSLKVKLRAVPEKGRANEELLAVLAEHFKVPKGNVELLSGETSRRKRVRITRSR